MSDLDSKHYVWVGGKEYEIDLDTLVDWIKSGKIGPNDWIYSGGLTAAEWKRSAEIELFQIHSPRSRETPGIPVPPRPTERPVIETDERTLEMPPEPAWLFYVLSFLLPIAGAVIAAIFMSKADEASRRFGKNCLIAVLALYGMTIVCFFLMFFSVLVTTGGNHYY
jgi:hypothetical protein